MRSVKNQPKGAKKKKRNTGHTQVKVMVNRDRIMARIDLGSEIIELKQCKLTHYVSGCLC